jgi:hypothetical protein
MKIKTRKQMNTLVELIGELEEIVGSAECAANAHEVIFDEKCLNRELNAIEARIKNARALALRIKK